MSDLAFSVVEERPGHWVAKWKTSGGTLVGRGATKRDALARLQALIRDRLAALRGDDEDDA